MQQDKLTQETKEALSDLLLAAELKIYREFKYADYDAITDLKAEINVVTRLQRENEKLFETVEAMHND